MPQPPSHYFTPRASAAESAALEAIAAPARWTAIHAAGVTLEFTTGGGVFSKSGLDAGSRLLLETVAETLTEEFEGRICDLGCGWGPVGGFLAARAPRARVFLSDINWRAVVLARLNLTRNGLRNGAAWCGDGLDAVADARFDMVLSNPPVRAGNVVIQKLYDDSFRSLAPGGSLWVVLRTAQGAKAWRQRLQQQFGQCRTVAIAGGYRVMRSEKLPCRNGFVGPVGPV